jgi:hypothetical protein
MLTLTASFARFWFSPRILGDGIFGGNPLWGIGKTLMIQESYEEAIPWLRQSLAIFESARVGLSMALVWSELVVCKLGLGLDQQSLDLLRQDRSSTAEGRSGGQLSSRPRKHWECVPLSDGISDSHFLLSACTRDST